MIGRIIAVFGGMSLFLIIAFSLTFCIGAWLWPYTINSWLVYSGKPEAVEWWMGGLMGLVPGVGQSCIPAAFITFVLMLFIGG